MNKLRVKDFDKAKVLWQDYEIVYDKDLQALKRSWGECSPVQSKISIEEKLKESKMLSETIVHELLHASINLIDAKLYDDEKANEAFSNALLTLMKDNKELFKAILEEL